MVHEEEHASPPQSDRQARNADGNASTSGSERSQSGRRQERRGNATPLDLDGGSGAPGATLEVAVGWPAIEREGTKYFPIVTTRSDAPGQRSPSTTVYRRYSELEALDRHLQHAFEGCFLPDMPPKELSASAAANAKYKTPEERSTATLRTRRRGMACYLQPLVEHPLISLDEGLALFLTVEDLAESPRWAALIPSSRFPLLRGLGRGKAGGDVMSGLKWLTTGWREEPGPPPPEEERLTDIADKMRTLHDALTQLEHDVSQLLQAWKQRADAGASLGCDLSKIHVQMDDICGKSLSRHALLFQGDGDALQATMNFRTGCASTRTAVFHALRDVGAAQEDCQDILQAGFVHRQLVGGLLRAFEARVSALHAWTAAQQARDDGARRLAALGTGRQTTTRALKLRNELDGLGAAATAAEVRYATIKQRNLDDLARLQAQRERASASMLRRFALAQAEQETVLARRWVRAAEALGAGKAAVAQACSPLLEFLPAELPLCEEAREGLLARALSSAGSGNSTDSGVLTYSEVRDLDAERSRVSEGSSVNQGPAGSVGGSNSEAPHAEPQAGPSGGFTDLAL